MAASLFLAPTALANVSIDDEPAEEAEAEEDKEEVLALVGGEIHTGLGGVLRDATILVRDGKIGAFGYDVDVPEDAEVVDVSGMRVYPGLIAVGSFGLFGSSGNLDDSVDPYNQNMTLALAAGITTAVDGNSVAKLKRGHVDGPRRQQLGVRDHELLQRQPPGAAEGRGRPEGGGGLHPRLPRLGAGEEVQQGGQGAVQEGRRPEVPADPAG